MIGTDDEREPRNSQLPVQLDDDNDDDDNI